MGEQEITGSVVRIDIPDAVTIHSAEGVLVVRESLNHPLMPTLTAGLDPGTDTFRHLAQAVVENNFDVPPIACVRYDSTGWRIFLFGDISAQVDGTDPQPLTGSGRSTWVEQDLPSNVSVLIRPTAAPPFQATAEPDSAVFAETAVPAEKTALQPAAGETPAPIPPARTHDGLQRPTRVDTAASIPDPNLIGTETHRDSQASSPSVAPGDPKATGSPTTTEPVAPRQRPLSPDTETTLDADQFRDRLSEKPESSGKPTGPLVTAKVCPCGAANPLTRSECRTCGSGLRRDGVNIEQAPRPPLGTLIFDDGARHELTRSVVMGRAAPTDHLVGDQPAEPITVISENKHVSKIHLEVRTIDWTVNVVDLDSANGTHVEGADGRAPRRLRPNVVEQIASGDLVKFGDRSFTFEAAPGL